MPGRGAPLLIAAMLIEYFAAPLGTRAVPTSAPPLQALQAWLAQQPTSVIVELPLPVPEALWGHETEYQMMSIYPWHTLATGYSGNAPDHYVRFLTRMRTFPADGSLAALRDKRVRWVIVHQALMDPAAFVALMERVVATPDLRPVGTYADHWGAGQGVELRATTL